MANKMYAHQMRQKVTYCVEDVNKIGEKETIQENMYAVAGHGTL